MGNVEPPVMRLTCCTSLSRIDTAVRGPDCDHLQCFDLDSYVHTMRKIPPKHAWCCPICDRPAPVHRLRVDTFAQSILDATEPNVTEVLVADSGKWEVSAVEEDIDEESSDDGMPFPFPVTKQLTQVDLQQAALNLGRAFSAPSPAAAAPVRRDRSRSPYRQGVSFQTASSPPPQKSESKRNDDAENDKKREQWEILQGIAKPKEETRIGWLPEGAQCSICDKVVVAQGGVYCGRQRSEGNYGGCFQEICWKCMNKGTKASIGSIKTSKTEFSSLGPDAWWMHEKCMSQEDKDAYFGEEDDDENT